MINNIIVAFLLGIVVGMLMLMIIAILYDRRDRK